MRKPIELGLRGFNPKEAGPSAERTEDESHREEEEPTYRQQGSERIKRTWEGIKSGFMSVASRAKAGAELAAASPEMVGDALRAAHEKGGQIKD